MMRKAGRFFLCLLLVMGVFFSGLPFSQTDRASAAQKEMRGLWVSVFDFPKLGLNASTESVFLKNADKFLTDAKANGVNTIFLHVRAFDDAIYPSKTFRRNQYVSSAYDPLKLMVQQAHSKGMELHAWMNPYRLDYSYYLDPARQSTTQRINTAVSEVMAYDVDGIHFDDYFYHASEGYKDVQGNLTMKVGQEPSPVARRSYINQMVQSVYKNVKQKDRTAVFGISPQGNLENCRMGGADIDRWISEAGYVDYLMPQIYWSNQWGASGNRAMFSQCAQEWKQLNQKKIPLYAGLALYRAGTTVSDDPGWKKKSTNLKEQVQILRNTGFSGYTLFSAQDLYRTTAGSELSNLRSLLGTEITAQKPAALNAPVVKVSNSSYNSLKLTWKKQQGVGGYQIYRATSKNGTYKKIKTLGPAESYKNTGLETGKTYYYKIRAYKGNQYSPFSAVKSAAPQLAAPKTKATAGKRMAVVKWNKISGAKGYKIYRAKGTKGKFKAIKTITKSSTVKYTNKKLSKGKKYTFKIRAYGTIKGKKVYSKYSNAVTLRIK